MSHHARAGRIGGKKGGPARAASLSPERRSEIARLAAEKRWSTLFQELPSQQIISEPQDGAASRTPAMLEQASTVRAVGRKSMRWITVALTKSACGMFSTDPGVYSIFVGKRLIYIGSSDNVQKRVLAHLSVQGIIRTAMALCANEPITVRYKTYKKSGRHLMQEARLIRRLSPPLNVRGVQKDTGNTGMFVHTNLEEI